MRNNAAQVERVERHVRHATFEQLSAAGYDVMIIEDGALPLGLEESPQHKIPERWMRPQPVISPKVAKLMDAELFPNGSAITPDGLYCYFDSTFNPENWKTSFPSRFRFADPESVEGTVYLTNKHVMEVPGRCFSTLSNSFRNFGHFVHDVLIRIFYEDLGAIAPGREKVIAPKFAFPMQKALFEKIYAGYELVQAPPRTSYKVQELLLPANLCSWTRFNPKGVAALADRMRRIMAPYAANGRLKVCVSRRDSTGGFNLNERDFVNVTAYESHMRELGYRVLEASSIEQERQFQIWSNASSIVGVHGAGMMNMIMMPAGSLYTEISGYAGNQDYAALRSSWTTRCAAAAGHRVNGIESSHDEEGRQFIDIQRLETLLRKEVVSQ